MAKNERTIVQVGEERGEGGGGGEIIGQGIIKSLGTEFPFWNSDIVCPNMAWSTPAVAVMWVCLLTSAKLTSLFSFTWAPAS